MVIKLQHTPISDIRNIPQSPGVYFFRASGEQILYIGKASNLKERLRYYLKPRLKNPPPKLLALLKEAESLSWEILGSEAEALIREAGLIKKYRPKYNVLMRDDKNYFYAGFTQETFPKVFITHQRKTSANYIGPFTGGGTLRTVLKTLRRVFPYCTCLPRRRPVKAGKNPHQRQCLNAKIGRCPGFCCIEQKFVGKTKLELFNFLALNPLYGGSDAYPKSERSRSLRFSPQISDYAKNISSIKQILSGKNKSLLKSLKKEMQKLSASQKYEEAGKLRDQIRALLHIFAHKDVVRRDMPSENNRAIKELETLLKISEINRIEAYDIANIHGKFAYGSMVVFSDGALRKDDYRLFKIKTVLGSDDPRMLAEVVSRRFKHREWAYPEVIIVDGSLPQLGAVLAVQPPSKIIALTKNKRHAGDHVFIPQTKNPVSLSRLPESLKNLILLLDAEAHRFAISRYRKSHRKNLLSN